MSHSAMALKPRQRILVLRYRFIGDTLLTVPFLRNLRAAYPEARIDMLVAPNSGELLRDCPYVDNLIYFDTTRKHRYENPTDGTSPRRTFWSYVRQLRENHYDTAFVLKRSFSSAALAFLAGIPERIGFNAEGRGFLLTTRVPYPIERHEIDCFLDVLTAAGLPVLDRHLESWWREPETAAAAYLLEDTQGLEPLAETEWDPVFATTRKPLRDVVLHFTSSNPAKQWPLTQCLELTTWLLEKTSCRIHSVGAPGDRPIYDAIQRQLPPALAARFHIHCGRLNLLESMAFLKQMDLMVGVDSGTLHMAAAVHVPVIALFGPMDERKWQPPGSEIVTNPVSCRPCHLATPCRHAFICMQNLQIDAVIEKIKAYAGLA